MTIPAEAFFDRPRARALHLLFHYSRATLAATAWVSAALFGLYILAFYGGALSDGAMTRWNQNLAQRSVVRRQVGCICGVRRCDRLPAARNVLFHQAI